jgi:hypothetical protein
MVAGKLGLLTATLLLCTPDGVLAQRTGGVSGGMSSGFGTGGVSGGGRTGGVSSGVGTVGVPSGVGSRVSSGVATGGVSSGVATGSRGGGSRGNAAVPSSVGSVVGNVTALPGASVVQTGNSQFQTPVGVGPNAPAAVPGITAQPGGGSLGVGQPFIPR